MSFSLQDYAGMVGDAVRVQAYARAMRQVIRPGDLVLDLGAGAGFFSLLACQLGARQVFACDTNPAIQVARELADRNGLADRITCIEGPSERLVLATPVDVIVSDLRGKLPLYGRHLPTLVDARERHLRPGGVLLPLRDQLWVALAETAEEHREAVAPWGDNHLGLDLRHWSTILANMWRATQARSSQLASDPVLWAELDYRTVRSPHQRGQVACIATRAATVHGFFLWFDATIAEDVVGFSGGPDAPKMVYGCAFFPWPQPVTIAPGDRVEIDLEAVLVGDEYTWTWRSQIGDLRFAQSTFLGAALSPEMLRRRAADHVPELTEDGRVVLRVLESMARRETLGQIAADVCAEFPRRFRDKSDSLGFVGQLATKHGV